ncbi:hypothetical protein B5M45_09720 [Mycobacterium simiae]|uniref:Uncharacterized protein n=1 Tax=Mycobacterium simiae TaxID=1784 RepID=A0A1X0Y9X5_MYCSI|nr:hypothetical protein B5M45_09720 [Mycobacterium simiae]
MGVVARTLAIVVSPLAAIFIPEVQFAIPLCAGPTGRPDGQRSVDGRANAFGRQTWAHGAPLGVRRRRRLPWRGWVIGNGRPETSQLDATMR